MIGSCYWSNTAEIPTDGEVLKGISFEDEALKK
jgi:hypothetical protein